MRVLVVDQDSAQLESIARSLRDRYIVDAVTNKGDCLDLLRQNTFEVIVAGERLEDGSGLELLGQAAKRWPSMLRIFAADRQRLQLLKGRLGPFELFQTLTYPLDPDRLISALELAGAAQDANADTANIQHVVLGADVYAEETGESDPFPPPKPEPRAVPEPRDPPRVASLRSVTRSGTPLRVSRSSGSGRPTSRRALAVAEAPEAPAAPAPPKRNPVRAPLVSQPRASAPRAIGPQSNEDLAEVAEIAREVRSALEPGVLEPESHRRALLVCTGALVLLAAVLVGFKIFGGPHQGTRQSPPLIAHREPSASTPPAVAHDTSPSASSQPVKSSSSAAVAAREIKPPTHEAIGRTPPASRHPKGAALTAAQPRAERGVPDTSVAKEPALAPETPVGMMLASPETLGPTSSGQVTADRSQSEQQVPTRDNPTSAQQPAAAATGPSASAVPPAATRPPATSVTLASAAPVIPNSASSTPGTTAAPPAPAATPASTDPGEPPPVVREAKLIHRVNADYPSAARHEGIQGFVELAVIVSGQGMVTDVSVAQSTPPGVFDKAAISAVRRYRYDPRYVDGLPAEAHLRVRLDFGPDPGSR
jgi:protein TonB